MCGIAGFVGLDDDALLHQMCASIAHRGPDDAGFYSAPGVGLAMRRLAGSSTGLFPLATPASGTLSLSYLFSCVQGGELSPSAFRYSKAQRKKRVHGLHIFARMAFSWLGASAERLFSYGVVPK